MARAVWRAGACAGVPLTGRFLRLAALLEKKDRNWAAAAALLTDAVRRDPQVWGLGTAPWSSQQSIVCVLDCFVETKAGRGLVLGA